MAWPENRNIDLETFNALDAPTRSLILRLLDDDPHPSDADWDQLEAHPQGKMLASWLLELPAYANSTPDDEGDE